MRSHAIAKFPPTRYTLARTLQCSVFRTILVISSLVALSLHCPALYITIVLLGTLGNVSFERAVLLLGSAVCQRTTSAATEL